MDTLSFNSALISAEFLLIEEGTSDRVLYRTAGSLMRYANEFYNSMHRKIEALEGIRDNMRRISNQIPNPLQSSDVWRKWFGSFQRLISPLEEAAKSLEETIGPQQ